MNNSLVIVVFSLLLSMGSYAQKLAVKSNLLYDATGSMNLGLEVALSNRLTLDLSGNYNPWTINTSSNSKIKHFLVQPELRYWSCEKFAGHFFGVHVHYAYYNVGGSSLKNNRYDGWLSGAGFTYGYQWLLSNRWSIEASLGVGYAYIDYKKYDCQGCGRYKTTGTTHYFGPTKLGLSLIYIIK